MKKTIKQLIKDVLEILEDGGIKYSDDAVELVYETGNAETNYRHLEQIGGGPGISFWQIEIATLQDNWDNYIVFRKKLIEVLYRLGYIEKDPTFSALTNIAVAIAMCRIYYWRQPGSIPKTMSGRAEYWKKRYNTEQGAGTVRHYMEANE